MPLRKKNCVHYLLGLSISSIAERSFYLAFLSTSILFNPHHSHDIDIIKTKPYEPAPSSHSHNSYCGSSLTPEP